MIKTDGKSIHEVFEELFKALVEQGERCMDGDKCAYGNEQGQHCAVGFLLPPEFMRYGRGVINLVIEFGDLGPNDSFIRENARVLELAQDLHDSSSRDKRHVLSNHLKDIHGIDNEYIKQWVELGA